MFLSKKGLKGPRINQEIRALKIRLIDENGEMKGVISFPDALLYAKERNLDLIEISPDADPPVCKVSDYGRLRYQEQKKKSQMKKNQQLVVIKEIQLRPNIQTHDYEVKLGNARKFLQKGDKVKLCLQFRGREMAHQDIGKKVMEKMIEDLSELGTSDSPIKLEGRRIITVISPIK